MPTAPAFPEIFPPFIPVNQTLILGDASAFAPRIAHAGGGIIVNVLSVVSLFVAPFNATYCCSKHAAMALTDGARIQLRRQPVHVVGVYAGFIDTDMARSVGGPKVSPRQVAERTVEAMRGSRDHVFGDTQQHAWDTGAMPWGSASS